jgi:uncharacterized membrane protein
MSATVYLLLHCAAVVACGLIGGVFFAFSNFVMKALGRVPVTSGMAAMQSINVVVLNPVFLGIFTGTAVLCGVLAVSSLFAWHRPGAGFQLGGSLLYIVGTFLVTLVCNVPRNTGLAEAEPASAAGATLWADYLVSWTAWNHVRTVAALLAAVALLVALWSSAQRQL